jgi:hypothetical protein
MTFFSPLHSRARVVLVLLLVVAFWSPVRVHAAVSITTCTELQAMSDDLTADYVLANDINCTGFDPDNDGKGFIPVGTSGTPFTGSFDGAGHTISNLTIARSLENYVGLFGSVDGGAGKIFQNVTLTGSIEGMRTGALIGYAVGMVTVDTVSSSVNVVIHDDGTYSGGGGGLVGEAIGTLIIIDAAVSGNVSGASGALLASVGGIVGYTDDSASTMTNVSFSGTLTISTVGGVEAIGGLAGQFFGPSITSGTVTGDIDITGGSVAYVGGLMGYVSNSVSISGSSMTGAITINSDTYVDYGVGGIIGDASSGGSILNSFNTGTITVTAGDYVSYGVGGLSGNSGSALNITSSYTTGDITVTAANAVGDGVAGLAGYYYYGGTIDQSYSSGSISVTSTNSTVIDVGGIFGYSDDVTTITDSFSQSDITVSAGNTASNIGGLLGRWDYNDLIVSNSYAAGNITVDATSTITSVGGFIGAIENNSFVSASVSDSFSAGTITLTSGTNGLVTTGGFIGEYVVATVFSNNFYDKTTSTEAFCTGQDDPDPAWCSAIENDAAYFRGNDTNPPLDSWDFATTWETVTGLHPILQNLTSPYPATPALSTSAASSLAQTSVTGNGNILSIGEASPTVRGFVYGASTSYGATTTENGAFSTGAFTGSITGLACGTLYHYASYATNTAGTGYGDDTTFTTSACPPSAPTLTTSAAVVIAGTQVTAHGAVTATGGQDATARGFVYGTTGSYGSITTENGTFSTGAFTGSITGLTCGTLYHYASYATNPTGTGYGDDTTFTTLGCPGDDPSYLSTQVTAADQTAAPTDQILDADGNVYIAGTFSGTIDFDTQGTGDEHTSTGDTDIFLSKYTKNGSYEWTKTFGGSGDDSFCNYSKCLAVDTVGNVYLAGYYAGTVDFDPTAGADDHTSNGGNDAFVISFDSDGARRFINTFGGVEDEKICSSSELLGPVASAKCITTDTSGNVYVIGNYRDTVDFDPSGGVDNHSSVDVGNTNDFFLTSYDSSGNYRYTKTVGGSGADPEDKGDDSASSVVTDSSDRVYVAGTFNSFHIDFDPSGGTDIEQTYQNDDYSFFLTSYNSDGSYRFTTAFGNDQNSFEGPVTLMVDHSDNVYMAGQGRDITDFDPGVGVTAGGSGRTFIASYTTSGAFRWASTFGGFDSMCASYVDCLAFDSADNVYIADAFTGTKDFDPTVAEDNHTSNGGLDVFLTKYATDGTYVWTKTFGGSGDDYACYYGSCLSIDSSDSVYFSGEFTGIDPVDFDPTGAGDEHTSNGSWDIFLTSYDGDGAYRFTQTFGGAGMDESYATLADDEGTVHIDGYFNGTVDFDPGAGVDTHSAVGDNNFFLATFSTPTPIVEPTPAPSGGGGGGNSGGVACGVGFAWDPQKTACVPTTTPGICAKGLIYDIDDNGKVDALTDGLLLFRYISGMRGSALLTGVTSPTAQRITASSVEAYLSSVDRDIDGGGTVTQNDGMLLMRLMFGIRGASLTAGLLDAQSKRTTDVQFVPLLSLARPECVATTPTPSTLPDPTAQPIPGCSLTTTFTKDLSLGMTDPQVKLLQQYLNIHGFAVAQRGPGSLGNETVFFGAGTLSAVKKFQQANGISPVSGFVGPLTRAVLNCGGYPSTPPSDPGTPPSVPPVPEPACLVTPVFTKDLSLGTTDAEVLLLQRFLNTHGFPVAVSGSVGGLGNETSFFGLATARAVREYQRARLISPVSGFVGPKTRAVLNCDTLNPSVIDPPVISPPVTAPTPPDTTTPPSTPPTGPNTIGTTTAPNTNPETGGSATPSPSGPEETGGGSSGTPTVITGTPTD